MPSSPSQSRVRIYLVEEEALGAAEIGDRLVNFGYEVLGQSSSGARALEEIPGLQPDLVLMGLNPSGGLDGLETTRRLRAHWSGPVVLLSAASVPESLREAIEALASGFLAPPFDERVLHATLQAARYRHEIQRMRQVEKERDRFEFALRASRICTWENDVAANRFTLDPAWAVMRGLPAGVTVTTVRQLIALAHPADRASLLAEARRVILGERDDYLVEHRVATATGDWIWIQSRGRVTSRDAQGRATLIVGTNSDISARRTAEDKVRDLNRSLEKLVLARTAALAESEMRFRTLFDRSPFPISVATFPEGRIVELNSAFPSVLGYTREEMIGRTAIELGFWGNPADRAQFVAELRTTGHVGSFETMFRGRAREPFPVILAATATELNGQPHALISIRDISLLRRAERRVSGLFQLSRALAESVTPRAAALAVLNSARELLGWDAAWFQLWNEERQAFEHAVNFDHIEGRLVEVPANPTALRDLSPLVRRAMLQGPQLHLRPTDAGHDSSHPFGAPRRSLSLMFAPIQREHRLFGMLSVQSYAPDAYDTEGLKLLAAIADHAVGTLARLQARAALAASEERFRALFESSVDAIFVIDAEDRIRSANTTAARMHGYTVEELLARRISDLDDPSETEFARRAPALRTRLLSGEKISFEIMHRRQDGTRFPVEVIAAPIRLGSEVFILATDRDITERRRTEAAMRESEARFRGVFDASPIPILLSTAPDGRLVEANAAALSTFGYARDEVIGRTTAEFGLWGRAEQREDFFRRIAADQGVQGFEAVMRTKAGDERTMLCTGSLVRIEGRMCIIASALDITALRKAEAEQAQVQARAFQSQKFEALGTLAGGVAHDFNNILTGILNYSALAQEDCPPGYPQIRKFLGEVTKCGNRAKELVRQILLFSRAESVQREPVLIQQIMREALTLLRSTVSAAVEIEADLDRQAPHVLGNATQIHQVVMNLAVNAVHAIGEGGGRLTVRLWPRMVDAVLAGELAELRPGPHVCIEVTDTGGGMDQEMVARIFEPFFTTKKIGEGTGLGLAVVHSVVRSHGGAIRVRTRRGVGTTFELFFPAHGAPAAPAAVKLGELSRGGGQRILLVDDEPAITESMQIALRRLGYQVTSFNQPEAALAHFWTAPDGVDALVTDFQMPGMNGVILAKKILSHRPKLPVLIASGFAGSMTAEKMREEGVSVFLQKPIELAHLANVLARMLRESK